VIIHNYTYASDNSQAFFGRYLIFVYINKQPRAYAASIHANLRKNGAVPPVFAACAVARRAPFRGEALPAAQLSAPAAGQIKNSAGIPRRTNRRSARPAICRAGRAVLLFM